MPTDIPIWEAVHRGVLAFNSFPEDAEPSHRDRMRLILRTPALQAHSVLRYSEWRAVIANYVAARTDLDADSILPSTVGQVSLPLALSAYDAWLGDEDANLHDLLDEAIRALRGYLAG